MSFITLCDSDCIEFVMNSADTSAKSQSGAALWWWKKNFRSFSYPLLGCQKWLVPMAILALTCYREEIATGRIRGEGKNRQLVYGLSVRFLLAENFFLLSVLKPMDDKAEVLHHKFPFRHSVLRTYIQHPYHFEVKVTISNEICLLFTH